MAIRQKIISTGHELEISSWGVDPISNHSRGKETSTLLLLRQHFQSLSKVARVNYPEIYLLFRSEIRVVFSLELLKLLGQSFLHVVA